MSGKLAVCLGILVLSRTSPVLLRRPCRRWTSCGARSVAAASVTLRLRCLPSRRRPRCPPSRSQRRQTQVPPLSESSSSRGSQLRPAALNAAQGPAGPSCGIRIARAQEGAPCRRSRRGDSCSRVPLWPRASTSGRPQRGSPLHCSGAKLGRYVPGSNSPTLICTEECFSPLHAFTGVLSV
jgi:hypothetical protein